jgi:hypothetical protein
MVKKNLPKIKSTSIEIKNKKEIKRKFISKNENKDNISINSLDLVDSNYKFEFLKNNEILWTSYFALYGKTNINKWNNLREQSIEKLTKNENEVELLIELITKIDHIRKNSKYKNTQLKFSFYETPTFQIWNIDQFSDYFKDGWNKWKFSSTYKSRYTAKLKKNLCFSWENILSFMGFTFLLKDENIWNYIWYLWHLPKKLIILWISRIQVSDQNDYWWITLLKEWINFFFEILRAGGIKKWLSLFLKENESDNLKKNKSIIYIKKDYNILQDSPDE